MKKSELRQMIREILHEEVEMRHSKDLYTVAFKDDPEGVIFVGTKPKCDDFVKMIQDSPATVAHGGVKVSKGADVPVIKK